MRDSAHLQDGTDYKHGITPPMRDVRNRMFRPSDMPSPAAMKQLAINLLTVSGVSHTCEHPSLISVSIKAGTDIAAEGHAQPPCHLEESIFNCANQSSISQQVGQQLYSCVQ